MEYSPKSLEETEMMEEAIIRKRNLLIILETFKHEIYFHLTGSKLLVTEVLEFRSMLETDINDRRKSKSRCLFNFVNDVGHGD